MLAIVILLLPPQAFWSTHHHILSSSHHSLPTATLSYLSVYHLASLHHRFYTFQVQQMHRRDSALAYAKCLLFLIKVTLQEANANCCLPYIRHGLKDLVIKSLIFNFRSSFVSSTQILLEITMILFPHAEIYHEVIHFIDLTVKNNEEHQFLNKKRV